MKSGNWVAVWSILVLMDWILAQLIGAGGAVWVKVVILTVSSMSLLLWLLSFSLIDAWIERSMAYRS